MTPAVLSATPGSSVRVGESPSVRLTLARVGVAIGGSISVLVVAAVLVATTVMTTSAQEGEGPSVFPPAIAVAVGYGALVVLALRGIRFAAVLVALTAWALALIPWIWLRNVLDDPYASVEAPVVGIVIFAPYAVTATYFAVHSLTTQEKSGTT